MIKSISILNDATFHPTTPTAMDDLQKFNYIFGSNGTGKTTLSRIIADPDYSSTSQCTWQNSQQLETVVLNRDFVEKNFNQMPGVFTLGERAKDTEAKIIAAKAAMDKEQEKFNALKRTLVGEDDTSGKKGELTNLESNAREKFWVPIEKIKKEKNLADALTGFLNDKEKCKKKILEEANHNKATLKNLSDLEKRASTVFGSLPSKQSRYQTITDTAIVEHESNPILKKRVIGKEDVDIAAMIEKLGNSDWVRQGLTYYEQNSSTCPFCQQSTTEEFSRYLKAYFDEAYEYDTKAID